MRCFEASPHFFFLYTSTYILLNSKCKGPDFGTPGNPISTRGGRLFQKLGGYVPPTPLVTALSIYLTELSLNNWRFFSEPWWYTQAQETLPNQYSDVQIIWVQVIPLISWPTILINLSMWYGLMSMPIMSGTKLVGVSVLPRPLESHIWAQLMWLMCTNSLALGAVLEE